MMFSEISSPPLVELSEIFKVAHLFFPEIRVFTRSGDTSQAERRKILRHPPEILITTPESLNLLLSSNSGKGLLSHLQTVILDEIHAVLDSKRGVHRLNLSILSQKTVGGIGFFQRQISRMRQPSPVDYPKSYT